MLALRSHTHTLLSWESSSVHKQYTFVFISYMKENLSGDEVNLIQRSSVMEM